MKASKIGLMAAVIAGLMLAGSPALRAEDAKDGKAARKHERRPGGPGGPEMKERFAKMSEELKLTAEQKPKVEAALKEQFEKMRGMRDLSEDERREKGRTLREDMSKKMKEILTAEQFEKWEKTRHQRGPGGPREGRAPRKGGDTKK